MPRMAYLQGSIFGLLLFLISINVTEDPSSNAKLFANHKSLFSIIHDIHTSANNSNKYLERISK